ncbi:hypothetical protein DdX_20639 [Ditylenchus destructor]|uniref:Secreted protein n=1 Tax=Ditylenchus destructor TaxID=166010 RepID=A0AAD4MG93_9BILA|nr:hypothetical protein DdX_20639 [Ditylenchus destructor]
MALNKSTSHKFQLNHLICLLVGSLLMASSIEANELSSALSALHTEISGLKFDVHPSNMNNPTVRANLTTLNNGIVNLKNLTNTTSNIGKRVPAATPNKTLIGLDVTNISNALNGIEREDRDRDEVSAEQKLLEQQIAKETEEKLKSINEMVSDNRNTALRMLVDEFLRIVPRAHPNFCLRKEIVSCHKRPKHSNPPQNAASVAPSSADEPSDCHLA